jgi:hypothetical protein
MGRAEVTSQLRALMNRSKAARDNRWHERFEEIPRLVASAIGKWPNLRGAITDVGVAEIFFATVVAAKRKLLACNNKNWMRVFR